MPYQALNHLLKPECFPANPKTMLLILLALTFQNSFADVLPPQNIKLPAKISSLSAAQIQLAFQKLKDKHSEEKGALWWLKFKEGEALRQISKDLFCEHMEALSKEPRFPLNSLAGIYFYEDCSISESLFFNIQDFPDWLKLRAALAPYKRGKKSGNQKEVLDAAIYLATQSRYKELQTSYQKHARALAKELKDRRLTQIEEKLFQMAPRLNPHPQTADYLSVAHDFRKARNFKKAAIYYIKILNAFETSWQEKNQAFRWMAWIYKIQNNKKKLLQISRQWSTWLFREKNKKAWKVFYKNQLRIARRYWNLDQNTEALILLDSILKEPASTLIREEVHWLTGLIKMQEGFLTESLKEFDLALKEIKKNKGSQSLQEKILWKKAWILRQSQQLPDSIQTLKKLHEISTNTYTKSRTLFWIGENQRDLNRLFYASKIFRSLRKEDPVGYYGLMACYRLQKKPLVSIGDIKQPLEKMQLDTKDFNLALWIIALNKKELLELFLKSKEKTLKNQTKETFKDWLLLISLYQITGKYLNIFQTFSLMPPDFQKLFTENYAGLLFPLAFREEIEQEALRQKVSPATLFAIIRQESAFNRRARSLADAFGLMQLLPSTARAMAKKIRQPFKNYKNLYNVEQNIRLGTVFFKKLLSQHEGSFILSAAAYNAGNTPVKKWKATLNTSRPLDFIEDIPYEETRTYVRLVIRNFIIYNKILKDMYKMDQNKTVSHPSKQVNSTANTNSADTNSIPNKKKSEEKSFLNMLKETFLTDKESISDNPEENSSPDFPDWLFYIN